MDLANALDDRARLVLRFGLNIVSYVAVIVAGGRLFSSPASAFTWLLIAIVVLLVVSLRNTWDLLVTVGDVTLGGEEEKHRGNRTDRRLGS
jgi:hypothetical protein